MLRAAPHFFQQKPPPSFVAQEGFGPQNPHPKGIVALDIDHTIYNPNTRQYNFKDRFNALIKKAIKRGYLVVIVTARIYEENLDSSDGDIQDKAPHIIKHFNDTDISGIYYTAGFPKVDVLYYLLRKYFSNNFLQKSRITLVDDMPEFYQACSAHGFHTVPVLKSDSHLQKLDQFLKSYSNAEDLKEFLETSFDLLCITHRRDLLEEFNRFFYAQPISHILMRGMSLLHVAIEHRSSEVIAILKNSTNLLNIKNQKGQTPLQSACHKLQWSDALNLVRPTEIEQKEDYVEILHLYSDKHFLPIEDEKNPDEKHISKDVSLLSYQEKLFNAAILNNDLYFANKFPSFKFERVKSALIHAVENDAVTEETLDRLVSWYAFSDVINQKWKGESPLSIAIKKCNFKKIILLLQSSKIDLATVELDLANIARLTEGIQIINYFKQDGIQWRIALAKIRRGDIQGALPKCLKFFDNDAIPRDSLELFSACPSHANKKQLVVAICQHMVHRFEQSKLTEFKNTYSFWKHRKCVKQINMMRELLALINKASPGNQGVFYNFNQIYASELRSKGVQPFFDLITTVRQQGYQRTRPSAW